jgi:CubicO group peptidase (beta-lactamase class C family)
VNMQSVLPHSSPEAQGIASAAILAFLADAEQNLHDLHSFMLLRHGHVVAEGWWAPYAPEHPHMLYSLSKSFASTAVGLAVAEGRLSVADHVVEFFPDELPETVSEQLAAMQVRHLLSMSTGHAVDTTGSMREHPAGNWVAAFLAQPVAHEPGSWFLYNSGATYMLSAILHKLTGETLLDYLQPRLFAPLGITEPTWESCPRGVNVGGWGLSIKTEEIARFGQLYLQRGEWQGQQLVPAAWVAEATSSQVDNNNGHSQNVDWLQGYGYQFWRCQHGAYRGDGAFGQFCVVLPEQDTVIAITAGVSNMQAVLDRIWRHLLPAIAATPLPANLADQEQLCDTLAGLALQPQAGEASAPAAATVSGRTYTFAPNDQQIDAIGFDYGSTGCTVTWRTKWGRQETTIGAGEWCKSTAPFDWRGPRPVAASGAWTAPDIYVMQLCFYETPHCATISCRFDGNSLFYDAKLNVSFGPTDLPQLVGQAEDD